MCVCVYSWIGFFFPLCFILFFDSLCFLPVVVVFFSVRSCFLAVPCWCTSKLRLDFRNRLPFIRVTDLFFRSHFPFSIFWFYFRSFAYGVGVLVCVRVCFCVIRCLFSLFLFHANTHFSSLLFLIIANAMNKN